MIKTILLFLAIMGSPGATVRWEATERACLYYEGVLYHCYDAGTQTVFIGRSGPVDEKYQPRAQGRYCLRTVSSSECRTLYKPVFLPTIAR